MEILDLKLGGIPISTWLIIVGVIWICKKVYEEWGAWKEKRRWRKDYEAKKRAWDKENHWEPKIVGGVDCGKWVRNDGKPLDEDEWTPAGALLDRLAEKGPGSG